MILVSSSIALVLSVNQYKHEEIWNRILLSGVNLYQLLITEIILSIIVAILHVFQSEFLLFYHRDLIEINDHLSLTCVIALSSLIGSMIGNIAAIILDDFSTLSAIGCTVCFAFFISSGCLS